MRKVKSYEASKVNMPITKGEAHAEGRSLSCG